MIFFVVIFIIFLGLFGYFYFVKIDQEIFLIIDFFGIQMILFYVLGKESIIFIEMGKVKDFVINEVIYMVSI